MHRFIVLLLALCAFQLQANDTAMHSGESGPEPIGWTTGQESVIQMVSEHIQVRFGKKNAEVIARFTFRSHKKDGVARQTLGFPDQFHIKNKDWATAGPLTNIKTFVNGRPVRSQIKQGFLYLNEDTGTRRVKWEAKGDTGQPMAWHVVDVEFPPGEDVVVERRYRTGLGQVSIGPNFFSYTTFTGGNWKGNIEQMVADIELKDGLTVKDVALYGYADGSKELAGIGQHPGAEVVNDRHLRLVWRNFEPRRDVHRQGFRIEWFSPQHLRWRAEQSQ